MEATQGGDGDSGQSTSNEMDKTLKLLEKVKSLSDDEIKSQLKSDAGNPK